MNLKNRALQLIVIVSFISSLFVSPASANEITFDLWRKVTRRYHFCHRSYEVEQSILDWLRNECDLQMFLLPTQMPQGGHTETVDASEIELVTIWAKVQELSKGNR